MEREIQSQHLQLQLDASAVEFLVSPQSPSQKILVKGILPVFIRTFDWVFEAKKMAGSAPNFVEAYCSLVTLQKSSLSRGRPRRAASSSTHTRNHHVADPVHHDGSYPLGHDYDGICRRSALSCFRLQCSHRGGWLDLCTRKGTAGSSSQVWQQDQDQLR